LHDFCGRGIHHRLDVASRREQLVTASNDRAPHSIIFCEACEMPCEMREHRRIKGVARLGAVEQHFCNSVADADENRIGHGPSPTDAGPLFISPTGFSCSIPPPSLAASSASTSSVCSPISGTYPPEPVS